MTVQLPNTEEQALEQAARWFVDRQESQESHGSKKPCHQTFEHWLETKENQLAWQQISRIHQEYQQHQSQFNHQSLSKNNSANLLYNTIKMPRRKVLKSFVGFSFSAWLGWKGYNIPTVRNRVVGLSADISSGVGQSKAVTLADNTQVRLNTNSAVNILNISELELLKGELYLNNFTLKSSTLPTNTMTTRLLANINGKLLTLETKISQDVADNSLGARCTMRLNETQNQCELALYQGNASVHYQGEEQVLIAGQKLQLIPNKQGEINLVNSKITVLNTKDNPAWLSGELHANDITLADFVQQLRRYRTGYINLPQELENIRVAGVYPAYNSDTALNLLAKALPINVNYITPWFVSITRSQVSV